MFHLELRILATNGDPMKQILLSCLLIGSISNASTEGLCREIGATASNQPKVIEGCAKNTAVQMAFVKTSVDDFYKNMLGRLEECQANNADCTKYKIRVVSKSTDGQEMVSYQPIDLTKTNEAHEKALKDIPRVSSLLNQACKNEVAEYGYKECDSEMRPLQEGMSLAVNLSTFYMAAMLPPSAVKIDIADLIAGKPLGGRGAVITEVRESLLNATGTPDFIADYIRDPVNISRSIINNITREASSIINNICGDLCGTLKIRL